MSARQAPGSIEALLRELLAAQAAILERLSRIEAVLAKGRGPALQAGELAVMHAIRVAVQEMRFSAREVLEHADLASGVPLRAALRDAGIDSAKALGKLLRRAARAGDLGGYRIERVGADRLGALWRVCGFLNPQFVTLAIAPDHRIHRIR